MRKLLFVGLVAGGLLAAFALPASSQGPDSLDAKVTPLVLSVNISATEVDYGSLALSLADNSRSSAGSPIISVTNTGSVVADLIIRGSDAVPANQGDTTWTLGCNPADTGTVGQDQFAHRFALSNVDLSLGQALCSDSDKTLFQGVAALTGAIDFRLQMNMPTGSTGYSQRTSTVMVTAVQP